MDAAQIFLKQAGLLWLAGFREACCLHRGFLFCRRSLELLKRTGQCFLLKGLFFLGRFMQQALYITLEKRLIFYYCLGYYYFKYKWNLTQLGLDKRLDFFESNWAFLAGFGSLCVLAIFSFSQLVSYGVMAILFPLFVLIALSTQEEKVLGFQRRSWRGTGLGRLPLINAADTIA